MLFGCVWHCMRSHVWSASPGFVIPWYLFGIQPTSPGWKTLTIKPAPGNLAHGSYTLPTVKGPVKARFKQSFTDDSGDDDEEGALSSFELSVELPLDVTATVSVPRRNQESAAMLTVYSGAASGEEVIGVNDDVIIEEQEHHLTVRGVGPGRHRFVLAKRLSSETHSSDASTAAALPANGTWVHLAKYDSTYDCSGKNNTKTDGCAAMAPQKTLLDCQTLCALSVTPAGTNCTVFAFQESAKPDKNGLRGCWFRWGSSFEWKDPRDCPPPLQKGCNRSGDSSGCLVGKVKGCETDDGSARP